MTQPPYYILVSHSSIASPSIGAPSNTLGHPTIQYQYTDDSPLVLWPQQPNEHVLVLDYDPDTTNPPTVQSISKALAVTHLKVEEAPGAAAANENDAKNDRMYIIETTMMDSTVDIPVSDRKSAHNVLAQFRHRNSILRRALLYPNISEQQISSQPSKPIPSLAPGLRSREQQSPSL